MSFEIVVVGSSTGGLEALPVLLRGLPPDFHLPIVLVQHRGRDTDLGLCKFLNSFTTSTVCEPDDKQVIEPDYVYVAPCDYHLMIERGSFALSTDAPVAFARPSIDLLFESAADEFGASTVGVILTGASRDGSRGLAKIKALGGLAVVEDPTTATAPQMPSAAIESTDVDWILPLPEIGPCLARATDPMVAQYGS